MALIISDLPPDYHRFSEKHVVINNNRKIHPCVGCFQCWIKTPGECIQRDGYNQTGAALAHCDELILITRCTFGSLSPFVKTVIDRAISYVQPYFMILNGEMHHRQRYQNEIKISAYAYGDSISSAEQQTLQNIIKANAVNLHGKVGTVNFFQNADRIFQEVAL